MERVQGTHWFLWKGLPGSVQDRFVESDHLARFCEGIEPSSYGTMFPGRQATIDQRTPYGAICFDQGECRCHKTGGAPEGRPHRPVTLEYQAK